MWWISHSKLGSVIFNPWSIIPGILFVGAYIFKIKCRAWLVAGLTLMRGLLTHRWQWSPLNFVDQFRFLNYLSVPRSSLSVSINAWLLNHFRSLIESCFLNQRLAPRSLFWFPSQIRVYNIITIDSSQVRTSIIAMLRERAPRRSLLR